MIRWWLGLLWCGSGAPLNKQSESGWDGGRGLGSVVALMKSFFSFFFDCDTWLVGGGRGIEEWRRCTCGT